MLSNIREHQGNGDYTIQAVNGILSPMGWVVHAFRQFGRAISAVILLVGILFLPKQIQESDQALEGWRAVLQQYVAPLFEREMALTIFAAALVLWIVWRDVRPKILVWLLSRKNPPLKIEFPDLINHIGKYGPNKRSTYYLNTETGHDGRFTRCMYYVDVTNTTEKTIKNVSVHLHEMKSGAGWFPERRLVTQSDAAEIDIRPGQTEYFLLGFRDSAEMNAEHVATVDGALFRRLESEWQYRGSKHIGFMMVVENRGKIPLLKNNGAGFVLGIYAEDLSPSRHLFVLNCKDPFEIFYDGPLGPDESPITETTLGPVKMRREPTRYLFEDAEPQSHHDTEAETRPKTRPG